MAGHTFSEAVQETTDDIADAISRIEQNHGEEVELHNVQAHLLNLLELIERNPGIAAAADDLSLAAKAFVETTNVDGPAMLARRQRILREALLRFQRRIVFAVPSEKAKHLELR